ncbi:citronellyl-CoA dehydrogenase [Amycolatopsis bartoniae]|uniref:Acyl-CoA dehydrogenase n=1 Tax=Amycolatopsis bartoniae TaxID=941986 RepID=A0A8H9IWF6_9PSEU|nr:acyl-CoA dehydrogenase [Amycolatopsis bartoniae]MBB2934277.1 citronellyl-CoA dehydrogenase [Amycolatopsis bartoniae]TVT08476.1 acyl-CoA dehydrogenase [Amycolatopsis bartoniae]GHF48562.1 acyl-CoA dehydrogenase [Amycolatopsis bartoniae]
MAALSESGDLFRLYDGKADDGLDSLLLRRLIGDACAEGDQGLVLALCVQLATALPLLAETAKTAAALRVLDACFSGEEVLAVAATDEGPGSDLVALGTTVTRRRSGDLVLNGRKRWITCGTQARHALVLARHRPGRHITNFTWLLVPTSAPGVSVSAVDTPLFAGAGLAHLELADVEVPDEWVLGGFGRGLPVFVRHLTVERLASATWAIELCRLVLSRTVELVADRRIDGEPLSRNASVRQRLAVCLVQLSGLTALWERLHERIAVRHDAAAAALLKAASGTTAIQVLEECCRLYGAEGFGTDGVQQLRTEAAVFGIGGGATEVMLDLVADHVPDLLAGLAPAAESEN